MTKPGNTYAKRGLKPLIRVSIMPKQCSDCLGIVDITNESICPVANPNPTARFRRSKTGRCRGCANRYQTQIIEVHK